MSLADEIYTYYIGNKGRLSQDKLFHFATRMAAWRGSADARDLLKELQDFIRPADEPLEQILHRIITTPQSGQRNAHELRQPFFDKYPLLYGTHAALFRVRHLEAVYGIDAREALFSCVPRDTLLKLRDDLLADTEALKVLSTFAINYIYLLTRVVERDETSLDIYRFIEAAHTYDLTDKTQIQLFIYLYTHCIIGESNFYTRQIPEVYRDKYVEMLRELEPVIKANLDDINLDNKLEYLVCARICSYQTNLFEPVFDEASKSLSPDGTFVIDRHNTNIQADRNDFVKSEHRNVLYIMSTTEYNPQSTLVV